MPQVSNELGARMPWSCLQTAHNYQKGQKRGGGGQTFSYGHALQQEALPVVSSLTLTPHGSKEPTTFPPGRILALTVPSPKLL